jgi:hypothetical protein
MGYLMKRLKTTILAATLLLSTTSVQAGFVHTDWKANGDQKATLHEETGIEWLKLDSTVGLSINQTESLLATTYDGWRLPTGDEVELMISDMLAPLFFDGGQTSYDSGSQYDVYGSIWLQWMSIAINGSGHHFSHGFYFDETTLLSGVEQTYTNSRTGIYHNWVMSASTDRDTALERVSVFLVSDGGTTLSSQLDPSINANNINAPVADVSTAPTTLGLMGLALLGFTVRRRSTATLK